MVYILSLIFYMEVEHMLVLSRRQSEKIKLGDSIVVTVVRLAGDKVRLGIEAPADMLVLRAELDDQEAEALPAAVAKPLGNDPLPAVSAAG